MIEYQDIRRYHRDDEYRGVEYRIEITLDESALVDEIRIIVPSAQTNALIPARPRPASLNDAITKAEQRVRLLIEKM